MEFLKSYILDSDARALIQAGDGHRSPGQTPPGSSAHSSGDVSPFLSNKNPPGNDDTGSSTDTDTDLSGSYERLILHGRPHLCHIPVVEPISPNKTESTPSAADREKELDRAIARGAELLQDITSNQCLYYSTGWWTYSFCYDSQITQFHALPLGANGRPWPPQEDPETPSYVLGKYRKQDKVVTEQVEQQQQQQDLQHTQKQEKTQDTRAFALSTEVQTKAETNYLVQRLEGGTPCDLTGNDRKVEVQFHCNPQLTDRIGWIKETATCAYLMVIYTPRLCNDVAFQPPKESRAFPITCREIVPEDGVTAWEDRYEQTSQRQTLGQGEGQQIVLGKVEVGAMRHVGREGKRLERGRIVLTRDERAEVVVMQKDGKVSSLSKHELKKLKISPEEVDAFRNELQKVAGNKDWKIEKLDDVHGQTQLRGVVSTDGDDERKEGDGQDQEPTEQNIQDPAEEGDVLKEEGAVGSQEEYAEDG